MVNPITLPLAARSQEHDDWGYIRDANGRLVAVARYDRDLSEDDLNEFRRRKEDPSSPAVKLIVGRVNAHDELLLAAKEAALVIADLAKTAGIDPRKGTCFPRLMAAIAKAEGK